ncbi:MAG: tetratricopeptide repeat protein [Terriglobales bacterium]
MPAEEGNCPYCARLKKVPLYHREPVVLGGIVIIAVALFLLAHLVSKAYAARQQQLAQQWSERAERELQARQLDAAIVDFRTALAYSHDNSEYRLRLAEALARANRPRQARAYLSALWSEQPGDGTVNIELARLSAQNGNLADALRYYHGAIYGVWPDDPAARRREARLELVQFLLNRNTPQQAQAELMALAADLPPSDAALAMRVAELMTQAGDWRHARDEFLHVLSIEPNNAAALAGTGEAAFHLRDFSEASNYLQRAIDAGSENASAPALLTTAKLVLELDPYRVRLTAAERGHRISRSVEQAQSRLETCAQARNVDLRSGSGNLQGDYAALLSVKPQLREAVLRRNPEIGDAAMDAVFRAERDAAQLCGAGDPSDAALLLVEAQREGAPR